MHEIRLVMLGYVVANIVVVNVVLSDVNLVGTIFFWTSTLT